MARNTSKQDTVVTQVVNRFDEARTQHHQAFTSQAEKRYKAYKGELERNTEAAEWTSKAHPAFALQVVETVTANMVEDNIRFKVRPRPRTTDQNEHALRREAARTIENLLRYQFEQDRFHEKQRPFALQSSIVGLTVAKPYWKYGHRQRTRNTLDPLTNTYQPYTRTVVEYDQPCCEIVDARDFIWPEGSRSLEQAPWVVHRVWNTYQELEALENADVYRNVSKLKDAKDQSSELDQRDSTLFQERPNKDLIEVLEYWTDDRVVTVGNRHVLLADKPNPFWHGQKPFVVCSGNPYPFQIPGISDVELVADLQQMVWSFMNQRLDNLKLINNAVVMVNEMQDDPGSFELAPGEQWDVVGDPNTAVRMWEPNPMPAQISLEAEASLMGHIQNITGGMPFMSGTESQTVDQTTATGVSIITNLAQRRLAAKKQQYLWAYQRIAKHFLMLSQQFITDRQAIPVVGKDAELKILEVGPDEIQGDYDVEIEATSDAMMRQEKRAEAQALVQTAAQIAPVMMAVQQPLNMRAFVEDWLRAFDVQDYDRYFTAQPQTIPGAAPGQQQPQNGQQPGYGNTNPGLAAGPTSPSNQMSLSPEAAMQQMMAGTGPQN